MPQTEVPEGVVNLAHAFVEARHLRAWFYALERLLHRFVRPHFSRWQNRYAAHEKIRGLPTQLRHSRIRRYTKAFWRQFVSVLETSGQTPQRCIRSRKKPTNDDRPQRK